MHLGYLRGHGVLRGRDHRLLPPQPLDALGAQLGDAHARVAVGARDETARESTLQMREENGENDEMRLC